MFLCAGAYYLCTLTTYNENKYLAVLCRTVIGYVFCMYGLVYYMHANKINNIFLLVAAILMYGYISVRFGNFSYSSVFNDYGNGAGRNLSFILSLSGILLVISISRALSKSKRFFCSGDIAFLGKNSFHIMAVHLSGFLVLNCILTILHMENSFNTITGIYFKYPNIIWIYFFFSIFFSCQYVKMLHIGMQFLEKMKMPYKFKICKDSSLSY